MTVYRTGAMSGPRLPLLILAGLAGGLAEVVWIGLVSTAVPAVAPGEVLRQIVASFAPSLAGADAAPALGLAIHMALSVLLGALLGIALWRPLKRRVGRFAIHVLTLVALVVVWVVNFVMLLPVLNPRFVELMPPLVTLASKLLFGSALAVTLDRSAIACG